MISPFCTYPPTLYSSTFTCDFIKNGLYQICKLRFKNNNQTNQHHHKFSPISGNRMDTGRNQPTDCQFPYFFLIYKENRSPFLTTVSHSFIFIFSSIHLMHLLIFESHNTFSLLVYSSFVNHIILLL